MSVWRDLRKRSSGEVIRREDIQTDVHKEFKNIIDTKSWVKEYYDDVKTVRINKEIIDEIGDFHWDRGESRVGDYYVIDHFSQL